MMTITLSGMKFYGYHGCFEEERTVGTRFIVDLAIDCDAAKAVETDNVEHAINYVSVYQTIEKIMNKPVHLLETIADSIIREIKSNYPVSRVYVKVCKINPPLDGQTDYVAVSAEE